MSFSTALRRLLPVAVSIAIIVAAASILGRTLHRINPAEVWAQLKRIPAPALAMGALLVVTVYAVLALYEVIIVRQVRAPVSAFRAVLAALVAVPIGHAVGLGALSGGAVRYRIYSAAGVRFGILKTDASGADQFVATDEVPAVDGQVFGWVVEVSTRRSSVRWQEPRWWSMPISPHGRGGGPWRWTTVGWSLSTMTT